MFLSVLVLAGNVTVRGCLIERPCPLSQIGIMGLQGKSLELWDYTLGLQKSALKLG